VTAAGGSAADLPAWCAPHLVAPGHAKHQSGSDGTTADSSEPTTTHSSHRGHGHSHVSDSTATDDQQGDDSASQPQGSTSETQDSSSDDQQGDDSNDVSGSDSGSHHGGHGSDDSSGSDD